MANMNHWMPGGVGGLIVWGGIILFAGLLLRSLPGRRRDPPSDPETPLEILKRRYARGEIDQDEFERRKRELDDAG
ncbi:MULTISPECIES: SHOCT domain-containing protein [Hyphomonas]|jgi:putative membrane protein|uniref:SHOCT domain-containing protein n=1 Tax=Hyphomonas jannaschiana VP2 TaxID=1280952 RepID=A0A059FIE7_9PROT|nr:MULTISPECIES: SHOCT domain-containing protein [Hyphomonas]KCZ90311.1 hypothetical protein HJA_03751 [Hyphomonas jannaschiana VP2]MAB09393.1 hypothetical protein [Hyphomonas sp.]MBD3768576.1 SHOCT domain-containing protein [Rhodobacterales bacterium]RAN40097.1 hypothetical protein HY26_13745 [Hyphomonas sp. GM-8P]